ncbi:MAG: MBL fold metallo-hydrolase [Pseudobacteriovorax sp.]|nr:MBL fold metallo-hydrolase [Pseudobacteriovorax sp.]
MIFRQLFDYSSNTFTYILGDVHSKKAIIIDPVFEQFKRDFALLSELELELTHVLDTHCHADHVTSAWLFKQATECIYGLSGIYKADGVDLNLTDGLSIPLGSAELQVLATPGHTDGCVSFVSHDIKAIFTGDSLMIRGTGRTDFQSGSASILYRSIKDKIFALPDDYDVFPGHDYKGRCRSSIGEEKSFNPRIGGQANENDFTIFLDNLNLPHPKKIAEALPTNLKGGKPIKAQNVESGPEWAPITYGFDGTAQVDCQWLMENSDKVTILDVRQRDEYLNEPGYFDSSINVPLGELKSSLSDFDPSKPIVAVCRSGRRSAHAVKILNERPELSSANLNTGILGWENLGFPLVTRE